ncbi:MAG: PKD domain-containing protein, partial [Methylococcales bacterium]|nr:PKD domain-containing protein [Methylococcales bacterium]
AYSPSTVYVNTEVQFTDSSTAGGDAIIVSWAWNFGDGTTSTVKSPKHTYTTAGSVTVKLVVKNSCGETSYEASKNITVNSPVCTRPTASLSYIPDIVYKNTKVFFIDSSIAEGGKAITSWAWNFGDTINSTLQHPTHIYSAAGNYTVNLTVTNDCGQTDNTSKNIIVKNAPSSSDLWYQAQALTTIVDGYYWNCKLAATLNNQTLFCVNLESMITAINNLDAFIQLHADEFVLEGVYDILNQIVVLYNQEVTVLNAVYPCGLNAVLPETFIAKVDKITDGDTIGIIYNELTYSVRLLGINAPEGSALSYLVRRLACPTCDEERWNSNSTFYATIKTWMTAYWHMDLTFKTDPERQFDTYGRILAVLYDGDTCINLEELKLGFGPVYFYDENKQVNVTDYLAAETIAKDANLGVWFQSGTIHCISNPTAAEIWLDGVYTGHKTSSSVYDLTKVPVGAHKVTFKKYISAVLNQCSVDVTVVKDSTVNAECTLTPAPATFPVTILSSPSGAVVEVDGVPVSVSSVKMFQAKVQPNLLNQSPAQEIAPLPGKFKGNMIERMLEELKRANAIKWGGQW